MKTALLKPIIIIPALLLAVYSNMFANRINPVQEKFNVSEKSDILLWTKSSTIITYSFKSSKFQNFGICIAEVIPAKILQSIPGQNNRLIYITLLAGLTGLSIWLATRHRKYKRTNQFLEDSLNSISDDRFEIREQNHSLKERNKKISAQAVLGIILKDSVEIGFSINSFLKKALNLILQTNWFENKQEGFIILTKDHEYEIAAVSGIKINDLEQAAARLAKLPKELNPLVTDSIKESQTHIIPNRKTESDYYNCLLVPLFNKGRYLGVIGLLLNKNMNKDKKVYTEFLKTAASSLSVIISRERYIKERNEQQKKQETLNQKLFAQNMELEAKNEKIEKVTGALKEKNEKIEKVNKHITAGIEYAKYIQSALLPSPEQIKDITPEHFIMYRPKDVVSGDFYFIKKVKNFIVAAVGDCTGHGVAGALLSALSISILNDSTKRPETYTPDYTLELLRGKIKNTFKQFGSENHNGLDISLCIYDTKTRFLQYAGAFNPLFLVRNDSLQEYTATRNPIGFYPAEKRFENNEIQVQKDDKIYLFSDGYYDQVGGERRKKLTKKKFKKLIREMRHLPLEEQKQKLETHFDKHKGLHSQVDDVTIMGIKL